MVKLVLPTKKYENSYYELIDSAKKYYEYEQLGNARLKDNETFRDMLKRLSKRRRGININENDVASEVYFIINNEDIVGIVDLRQRLNKNYFTRLGHVTIFIKREERNKGYATEALKLVKKKYAQKYVTNILISCYTDNYAFKRVIEKNGGVLKSTYLDKIIYTPKEVSKYIINTRKDIVPVVAWFILQDNNIDFDKFKKYVDRLVKYNIKKIILIGGNVINYNNIIDMISYIKKYNIIVSMIGNEYLFSDYEISKKIVDVGLDNCSFFVDNFDNFDDIVKSYNNLKKMGINVFISYTLSDNNYSKFDKFIELIQENELNNLSFLFYNPFLKVRNRNEVRVKDLSSLCIYAFDKLKNTNMKFKFEMSIPLCSIKYDVLNEMIDKKCIFSCYYILNGRSIFFDSNFNVVSNFNGKLFDDNIKVNENNILEFWNSEYMNNFRSSLRKNPSLECENCKLCKYCSKGLLLKWLYKINSIDLFDNEFKAIRNDDMFLSSDFLKYDVGYNYYSSNDDIYYINWKNL